jgi:TPR repeat protein
VTDESRLQVRPKDGDSSLILSSARSSLVARGLRDAAALAGTKDPWSETRRLAEAGDARAQYELGNLYAERYKSAPWGFVKADYDEAQNWYRKAADQGHAEAKGKYYSYNFKFYPDDEWLFRAVAAEMSAMGLSVPQQLDEAAFRWRKAAEQGNAQAQFNLGNMYESGQGVSRDHTEAANWYRKAAQQGHSRAQLFLGLKINLGPSFAIEASGPNPVQRANWPQAAFWLGEAFRQGIGPVWDFFENASDEGFIYNHPGVGRWEWDEEPRRMDVGSLLAQGAPRDYAEAATWFRKAAVQGDANAQISLGCMCYHGQGVPQDYDEAEYWFRVAGDHGYPAAQFYVGFLLTNGRARQDDTEAVNWYRKAAEQGHANAQFNLGEMYYWGQGVSQNYTEAADWYRKAADQGNANAQFCLGWLLAHGQGVSEDHLEAARWYRNAAEQGHFPAQIHLSRIAEDEHDTSPAQAAPKASSQPQQSSPHGSPLGRLTAPGQ